MLLPSRIHSRRVILDPINFFTVPPLTPRNSDVVPVLCPLYKVVRRLYDINETVFVMY